MDPRRDRLRPAGDRRDCAAPDEPHAVAEPGRPQLPRYRRPWIIERTSSWLNTPCRRLTTRWERSFTAFLGFLYVAIIIICLRRL